MNDQREKVSDAKKYLQKNLLPLPYERVCPSCKTGACHQIYAAKGICGVVYYYLYCPEHGVVPVKHF